MPLIFMTKCPDSNKGICERGCVDICKYSKDCMLPKRISDNRILIRVSESE